MTRKTREFEYVDRFSSSLSFGEIALLALNQALWAIAQSCVLRLQNMPSKTYAFDSILAIIGLQDGVEG
jgi:hypothetical protein